MSSNNCPISVIMPVYNTAEDLLNRAVASVLAQSYQAFELLLIDDGSCEECAKACDRQVRKDQRVKVFHQENAGVSKARNKGIEEANGKWIMFVDSDDELLCDALEVCVGDAEKEDLDVLYCEIIDSYKGTQTLRSFSGLKENDLFVTEDPAFLKALEIYFVSYELVNQSLIARSIARGPVAKLFKHEAIREIRFDSRLEILEDGLFNSLAVSKSKKVGLRKTPVYIYHKNLDSAMHRLAFDERVQVHSEVIREAIVNRNLPLDAYYSQMCSYFFFVLNSLSLAGKLSYSELRRACALSCFQESFEKLDRKNFGYPSVFSKLKYYLACTGKTKSLWLAYRARTLFAKAARTAKI